MGIHNFDFNQEFSSLDKAPDHRSEDDQENSLIAVYDHSNPDIANMEREVLNLVNDSGAWTSIYLRTNDLGQVDETWEEDANPLYMQPKKVKGLFQPDSVATALSKYGIDSKVAFKVNYSRAHLLAVFGPRLIRKGDVIQLPHNTLVQTQNTEFLDGKNNLIDKFRVTEATDTGNFNYRWMYWSCTVENVTGDITVRPEE